MSDLSNLADVSTVTGLTPLLRARYGGTGVPSSQPAFPAESPATLGVLETLLSHRSVRAFLPDALPAGTLDILIAAAQSAPSSSNLQAWSVISVQDPARKARLAVLAGRQAHIEEAPLFLAWIADHARLQQVARDAGQDADGLRYLDSFLVSAIDAGLAAQNVVVAAESLGLGTVYIGALRNRPEEVAQELGLAPGQVAILGLVVGRPDQQRPAAVKPRLPQAVVHHRERYASAELPQHVAAYDRELGRYYAAQGLPENRWSEHAVSRVANADALNGRATLKESLSRLGFELA